MAVVKYGAIIDEIKGKVNGQIFQGGRNAPILRSGMNGTGKKMVNSKTSRQNQANRFSTVAKYWSGMRESDRLTWASLLGVWTFVDKFGDVYNGTPYQIFCECNINRLIIQEPILDVAPTFFPAVDINITSISIDTGDRFEVVVDGLSTSGQIFAITASKAVNESFPVSKAVFINLKSNLYTGAESYRFRDEWEENFGGTPPVGSFVYVKTWQTFPEYPRHQFVKVAKVEVI